MGHGIVELVENLFGPKGEDLEKDILFVLEVEVDGAVGDTGFPSDLSHGGLVVALLRKDGDGCFNNKMVFI